MRIEKKTWPKYFQLVLDGKKTFEIRLADFRCKPGDTLILREWDPKKQEYTGRELRKKVSYVSKTKDAKYWPRKNIEKYGLQVIGFGPENKK